MFSKRPSAPSSARPTTMDGRTVATGAPLARAKRSPASLLASYPLANAAPSILASGIGPDRSPQT